MGNVKQSKHSIIRKLEEISPEPTAHGSGSKFVFRANNQMPHMSTQVAFGIFKPGEACEEHLHPTMYEYFYFISGEGTYTIDGVDYNLEPEVFLEIPSGLKHFLVADKGTELRFVYWGVALD